MTAPSWPWTWTDRVDEPATRLISAAVKATHTEIHLKQALAEMERLIVETDRLRAALGIIADGGLQGASIARAALSREEGDEVTAEVDDGNQTNS